MVFLQKRPCVLVRVLSDTDCPPHDIFHTPCQYPCYYDSLYYPQYHVSDFQNSDSVCQWLLTGLNEHRATCVSCPLRSGLSDTAVLFQEGQFTVSVGDLSFRLSVLDIESASFSFCRLARRFVNLSVSTAWLRVAKFVLSQNPSWLNRPEDLYVRSLEELPRGDLY